LQHH
jgi:MICOS complex subunit MIC60